MASEQDDAVFDHSLDDDDDDDSQSQDEDDLENDDVLVHDDVLNEEEDEEEEEEEEEDINSPSTSSPAIPAATVALPIAAPSAVTVAAIPNGNEPSPPDPKRPRIAETLVIVPPEEKKPAPAPFDESRRLFQRLWTDEDEIELLQGFLDYTAQRGSSQQHHHDTALFYDQIKSKLQLDFNKNQLVEKLRRLKKKYRNVLNKIGSGKDFSFKSAHDHATFEISRKIWSSSNNGGGGGGGRGSVDDTAMDDEEVNLNPSFSNVEVKSEDFGVNERKTMPTPTPRSRKRSRSKSNVKIDDSNVAAVANNESGGGGVGGIEETVKSCLTPLFKELMSGVMVGGGVCGGRGIGGLAMNAMPLSFGMPAMMSFGSGEVVDERWRKQQMLELEVYSKRLELVQDQIKVALEELRSMGG